MCYRAVNKLHDIKLRLSSSPVLMVTPSEIEYPNTWQSQDPDCKCQLFEMSKIEEWDIVVG